MVYTLLILCLLAFESDSQLESNGFCYNISETAPNCSSIGLFEKGNKTKKIILEKALETLKQQYSAEQFRFSLSARWIPGSLLQVKPEKIQSVELVGGIDQSTNFEVIFLDSGLRHRSRIQLSVYAEQKLPVASNRLSNGKVIEEEDLAVRWISVNNNLGELISDPKKLLGQTLRRTLLPGQPFRHTEISGKYLINAGEVVKIIFERNGVHIQIIGEARQSGARNDDIRIYSNETKRKYLGTVIRPGVVKWKKTL